MKVCSNSTRTHAVYVCLRRVVVRGRCAAVLLFELSLPQGLRQLRALTAMPLTLCACALRVRRVGRRHPERAVGSLEARGRAEEQLFAPPKFGWRLLGCHWQPHGLNFKAHDQERAAGMVQDVQVRAPCFCVSDAPRLAGVRRRLAIENPLLALTKCLCPHPRNRRFCVRGALWSS